MIDTDGTLKTVRDRLHLPVFEAWVRLLSRVTPELQDVGERIYRYFDGMEEPAYALRVLRRLKLESRAYRTCPARDQFDFSGSEGAKTPTMDPSCLVQGSAASAAGELDQSAIDQFTVLPNILEQD